VTLINDFCVAWKKKPVILGERGHSEHTMAEATLVLGAMWGDEGN
jgi:hypothetical protein